jgi:hypothetical protein
MKVFDSYMNSRDIKKQKIKQEKETIASAQSIKELKKQKQIKKKSKTLEYDEFEKYYEEL